MTGYQYGICILTNSETQCLEIEQDFATDTLTKNCTVQRRLRQTGHTRCAATNYCGWVAR
jgi:hypothetical protein